MKCYRVSKFLVYKVFFPEVSETFDLLDVDRDGKLSRIEIAALLRQIISEMMSELMFELQNSQCWADSSWIGLYLWRNGYWKWVSVAKINFDVKKIQKRAKSRRKISSVTCDLRQSEEPLSENSKPGSDDTMPTVMELLLKVTC